MEIMYYERKVLLEENDHAKKYLFEPFNNEFKIFTIWKDGSTYDCTEHYNIRKDNNILFIVDKNYCMNQVSYVYSFKTKKLYELYKYNWEGLNIKCLVEHKNYFPRYKGIKIFSPYKDNSNDYTNEEISSFVDYLEEHVDVTITGEPGYPNYVKEK